LGLRALKRVESESDRAIVKNDVNNNDRDEHGTFLRGENKSR